MDLVTPIGNLDDYKQNPTLNMTSEDVLAVLEKYPPVLVYETEFNLDDVNYKSTLSQMYKIAHDMGLKNCVLIDGVTGLNKDSMYIVSALGTISLDGDKKEEILKSLKAQ